MDTLYELNRIHAALVNNHMHHDLKAMPEIERQTAIADVIEQMEVLMDFNKLPWEAALKRASINLGPA